jgi:hypothetical protein
MSIILFKKFLIFHEKSEEITRFTMLTVLFLQQQIQKYLLSVVI